MITEMNRTDGRVGVMYKGDSGRGTEWAETLSEMKNRNHCSSVNLLPNFTNSSGTTWQHQPHEPIIHKELTSTETPRMKPKTSSSSLSSSSLLPYSWRRSDRVTSQVRQATDRSYKHTYGDQLSPPFDINTEKEPPVVRQKSEVMGNSRSTRNANRGLPSAGFNLPTSVVTKIYDNLHQKAQDKRCLYVVKNLRRTTSSSKQTNLPTIIPYYNIQLVKSVSKVLTEEVFSVPGQRVEENIADMISRPMAAERKYFSPSSGNLVKSLTRSSTGSGTRAMHGEQVPRYYSTGREFRSADAYNKLLAVRHANKKINALNPTNNVPITSESLRHPTAKVSFKSDNNDEGLDGSQMSAKPVNEKKVFADTESDQKSEEREDKAEIVSTKHITSVRVSRRGLRGGALKS